MTDHLPEPGGGLGAADPPPPPVRRRRGLVVGLVVAVVVVVGVAVGLVVLRSGGDGPSQVVRTYLQALADGDAGKALDQGARPPDTTFVTHDALDAQRRVARIGAIDVRDGSTSGSRAQVSATYTFGDRRADETFSLTETGGHWKLDDTVYPVGLAGLAGVPGLTLLGAPTSGRSTAYVFPGPLVWATSNSYLTVTAADPGNFSLSPGAASPVSLATGLSTAGRSAAAAAVRTFVAACARSKDLAPASCPQAVDDVDGVDGTAAWTAPTDLGGLAYRVSTPVTRVYVTGNLSWQVGYVAEDFTGARKNVTGAKVVAALYGTVDLTKSPPVFSP